ncbi:MAG: glycoside hydrolase family 9 protein [Ignavibacteriales bacterium]|nr:glycoside hydrolase family 9 protein [Ignavibacteriales bacterium]
MKGMSGIFIAACVVGTSFVLNDDAPESPSILVDQMGYRPGDKKIVFLKERGSNEYNIVDNYSDKVVHKGKIHPIGVADANTGDMLFVIDFSKFKKVGTYRIVLKDSSQHSLPFSIDKDVYDQAALSALKSFYYQRCGSAIDDGSLWEHPICHSRPARYFAEPDEVKNVTGGWHDAGDYNKFVPTTAVSAAFLLSLYELQREKFFDGQMGIPEKHNDVPDILDEARWGLEWLMKMQEADGGVAHKVSIKKWTGEHLPHTENDTQYLFSRSTVATADVAAVTALAARLFHRYDKVFARKLLQSSLKAWEFLEANPSIVPEGGFKNPDGVEGGEYGDSNDNDERLWASVELLKATGNPKFHDYFLQHYQEVGGVNYAVSWQNVQNFAYYSYLTVPVNVNNYQTRSFIISTMSIYCDALLERINSNGYRYVLLPEQQYWGSNSVAMGHAYDLIMGYEATKHQRYLEGALDQLHYMLGRNTFGLSFVTGVGVNAVKHPYHQFSMLSEHDVPVPGMLVAGCNAYSRLNGKTISQFHGRSYEDSEKNYYVNEPAINYTASFMFVASYFSSFRRFDTSEYIYTEEEQP